MVDIIKMPKLEMSMEEGKLVKWYKKEGDGVSKGEPLFCIETDKTTIDIEATGNGIVRKLLISEGDTVPVFQEIALIGSEDETIEGLIGFETGELEMAPAAEVAPATAVTQNGSEAGSDNDYEVLVIGGGPGGYVSAIKAAQCGKRTAIVEKANWGGTCLNIGCIPTKVLLRSIEALREVKESATYGIKGVDVSGVSLDMPSVQKRKQSIVNKLTSGVGALLSSNGVTKINGAASFEDAHTINVDGKQISADHIIIATGSEAKVLSIPTSKNMNVMSSTEMLDMEKIPDSIVVIGGGVIGVEFAYFLANAGAKVTIVEFLDRILPMVDLEITNHILKLLKNIGIEIFTGSGVTEITDTSVIFNDPLGKQCEIKTDAVLMSVGRQAMIAGLKCESIGLQIEKDCIAANDKLETSVPNIYAIGDVNGKAMLAHVASMEGIVAVNNICGIESTIDYSKVPSVIYIEPEIACVGLTEEQAREKYRDVKVGTFQLSASGKAKVAGEERGMMKVIISETYGQILGIHMFCKNASEIIAEAVVAMKLEGTSEEIISAIHPHPTISESLQEAFHAAVDKAIHMS